VLVVPVPHENEGPPLQGVPGMADAAEDFVGGGAEGNREMEEPVEDQGSFRRSKVQPGGTGFPILYGHEGDGTGCGRGRRRGERRVGMGAPGAPEAGRGEESGGGGARNEPPRADCERETNCKYPSP